MPAVLLTGPIVTQNSPLGWPHNMSALGRHVSHGVYVMYVVSDKYSYEEWKDHPEQIPKGGSYYEVRETYKSV